MQWLLSMLCRAPEGKALERVEAPSEPLALLRREFSEYFPRFRGARIVDFGSGWGFQAVALAQEGAAAVLALETGADKRAHTLELAKSCGVVVSAKDSIGPEHAGAFDFVLSLDSMEHFLEPESILRAMVRLLKPGGRLLITFGPPWYAPYGAHLRYLTPVPWVHLLFSENALMRARGRFRSDGARAFAEVEGGLNKLTVGGFERLVAESGCELERRCYRCVWKLRFLGWLPGIRELFVNQVSVVLRKPI